MENLQELITILKNNKNKLCNLDSLNIRIHMSDLMTHTNIFDVFVDIPRGIDIKLKDDYYKHLMREEKLKRINKD